MAAELKILVCGRTGVGKSTLCNSLLGKNVCKIGHPGSADGTGMITCTKVTEELSMRLVASAGGGVLEVKIFDSPGLEDGDIKNDKNYVEDMYKKCKDVDLVLYCVDMTVARFMPAETRAIDLFTKKFGPTFWERCVFVLTKANRVFIPRESRNAEIEYHENIFKTLRKKMCSLLKDAGVPKRVCDLRVVAAGNFEHDHELETNDTESERKILFASERCKANSGPPIERVDFIPELWVTCLETVGSKSIVSFLAATASAGRVISPGTTVNIEINYTSPEPPEPPTSLIILNPIQEERSKSALLRGLTTAVAVGTGGVVGATAGIVFGPVGIAAGAAIGAMAGATVASLIKKILL